jgi:hypothetical protein
LIARPVDRFDGQDFDVDARAASRPPRQSCDMHMA